MESVEAQVMGVSPVMHRETNVDRIRELMERRIIRNADCSGPDHDKPATSVVPDYGRGLTALEVEI